MAALPLPSFYDTTVADSDARAKALLQQGRVAAAVGQGVRGAAGAVMNRLSAPLRIAVPIAQDFFSGLGGNTDLPTIPADTRNAVSGPSANPAPQSGASPSSVPPPAVTTTSPNSPPAASPLDQPDGATVAVPGTTSVPGVQRYDVPGQNPLYTNLPQADFAGKRSPDNALPSVSGFLNNLPTFAGDLSSGGGGGGMVSPGMDSTSATILSRVQSLLGSNSIVDNWRGRQLSKVYDRMQQGNAATANAQTARLGVGVQAGHLANEVPLAQLQASTARRGQDASIYPHLGLAGIQNIALKRLQAGGPDAIDEARSIAEIGVPRFAPLSRPLQKSTLPDGTTVFTNPDTGEVVKQVTMAESQALAKKKAQDQVAAGLVKPDGR